MIKGNGIPASADVVVVGGGVVGVAVAYTLARAGVQVCLLERNDIGSGTSSAAAAAALLQTKTSAVKLALARESLALLDELYEEFDHGFEYAHSGSLLAACSEAELRVVQDMIARLQGMGLAVHKVDGVEARAMMPVLGPTVIGASFSPDDACINPLELVLAYAEAAHRHGTMLCTATAVTGIERQGERILSVETTRGRLRTSTVVNAAGVWAPQLAQIAGLELPVVPLKGELMISEVMPPMMRGTLISARYLLSKANTGATAAEGSPKRTVGITLVQVARGNFLVGATREQAGYDRRSSFGGISELGRLLLDIAPSLANLRILRAYAGLRPLTADMLPVVGPAPGLPGFIAAAGHGGDGLILSAITGKLVAGLIIGKPDQARLAPLAWDRFSVR